MNSSVVDLIDKALVEEALQEPRRTYMGMSFIGHPCDRFLWLSYRWADDRRIDGRIARIFRRGNLEELILTTYLEMAGCHVWHSSNPSLTNSGQLTFVNGICKGHSDGVIVEGLADYPTDQLLLEMKTMNLKDFRELARKGVRESKPEHYGQQQSYIHECRKRYYPSMNRSLYIVTCKDNDEIYTEIIDYDEEYAERLLRRANHVGVSESLPPGLSDDPKDFRCIQCRFHDFCHESKRTRQVNCRTCTYSKANGDGSWTCARNGRTIPEDKMDKAYVCHIFLPDMVPCWKWHREESNADDFLYEMPNGGTFWNGRNSWQSKDIAEGKKDRLMGFIDTFKGTVDT